MIDAFEENEIQCDLFSHPSYQDRVNASFESDFLSLLNLTTTVLFSPLIIFRFCQTAVKKYGIPYVSYVYDCPLTSLYSCSLINSCNYVFLFDKVTYYTFKKYGIQTVFYLPLAANVQRLSKLICPPELCSKLSSEVSFVGSLYNEDHNFF